MDVGRVLKFGGAALADGPAVERACGIVARQVRETRGESGGRVAVVVSAHQGVTDLLERAAQAAAEGRIDSDAVRVRHRSLLAQLGLSNELLDRYWRELSQLLSAVRDRRRLEPAELDLALSFGERSSARIVARVLDRNGVTATPVDAWDLGITSDSNHGRARPLEGIGGAIRDALGEVPGVAVVTGFLAKDEGGNLTTLGRNGSDLTASVIAEAAGAKEIQYWKMVGGILTADPDLVPDARVLSSITYAEAAELAFHGARVLHPAAVAPVVRARTAVRVCNVENPDAPGTVFETEIARDRPISVASKPEVLRIDLPVDAPERRAERSARLFRALDASGAPPNLVSAHGDRVSAYVDPGPGVRAALTALGPDARLARDLASVALVGHGLGVDRTVGARALAIFERAGIEAIESFLGGRAASQAFVVNAVDLAPAVRALHDQLLAPAMAAG